MKKYFSTFGAYSLLQGGTLVLGALWPFIVATRISSADFGHLSLILASFLGIQTVLLGSLTTPTILYRYDKNQILKNLFIVSVLGTLAVILGSLLYTHTLPQYDQKLAIILITCGFSYLLRSVGQTLCIATKQAHVTAFCEGVATLLSIYTVIAANALTLPVLLQSQLPYGVCGLITLYYGVRALSQPIKVTQPQHSYWQLYGWQLVGLSASYAVSWGVVVLASFTLSPSDIGSLSLSLKFQGGIASLLFLMTTFYTPRLLHKEAHPAYAMQNTKVLTLLFGGVIALGVGGALGSHLWYETAYVGSTKLFMFSTVALLPLIYTARVLPLLNTNNQSIIVQKNAMYGAVVTVTGVILLTPALGATGVIMSIGLGYTLQAYTSWRAVRA